MKVLCVIPPSVPSYFNAGHHLPVFQVAAYVRRQGHAVTARDMGALNSSWADVCTLLVRGFDVIAVMNDFDAVDGFGRFIAYARELCPQSRLVTFGRGSRQIPAFFDRYGFDAIVSSGDYESGVAGFLDHLSGRPHSGGLRLKTEDGTYTDSARGTFLEANEWAFPDIEEIPYEAYDRLYGDDLQKFCGIPQRRELVVPVARGCPVGCSFCDVPSQQGLRERRVAVEDAVRYIVSSYTAMPFEYFSIYAPTFTLKREWVEAFCQAISAEGPHLRWKCVTTTSHLDEDLVKLMGTSGCIRISVGLESTHVVASQTLPRIKAVGNASFARLEDACARAGIELNCFLMVGMPDEPVQHAAATAQRLGEAGHRIRPTVYTPYGNMTANMSIEDYATFNRQLLQHGALPPSERRIAYEFLYSHDKDRLTRVMDVIPIRRAVQG